MYVYVPVIVYGRTHKHSLKRARQTHEKIRNNKAQPAYSSKKGSAEQVWMDQAYECIVQGPSYMGEYSFKQMDPKETETAVGDDYTNLIVLIIEIPYTTLGAQHQGRSLQIPAQLSILSVRVIYTPKIGRGEPPNLFISAQRTVTRKLTLLSNTTRQLWRKKYLPMC